MINYNNQLMYTITIPVNLKEIRPKTMDLPDATFEALEQINALMLSKNKEIVKDIAKQLLQEAIDPKLIAKITKLNLQEIYELS